MDKRVKMTVLYDPSDLYDRGAMFWQTDVALTLYDNCWPVGLRFSDGEHTYIVEMDKCRDECLRRDDGVLVTVWRCRGKTHSVLLLDGKPLYNPDRKIAREMKLARSVA